MHGTGGNKSPKQGFVAWLKEISDVGSARSVLVETYTAPLELVVLISARSRPRNGRHERGDDNGHDR